MARITMVQKTLMAYQEQKEAMQNMSQSREAMQNMSQSREAMQNMSQSREAMQNIDHKLIARHKRDVNQNIDRKLIARQSVGNKQNIAEKQDFGNKRDVGNKREIARENISSVKNTEENKRGVFNPVKKWKESLRRIWQNGEKDTYTTPKKAFGKHLVLNALETIWQPGQEISVERILAALIRFGNGRLLVDDEIQFTLSRIYMIEFMEFDSEDVCEVLYEILMKRVDLGLTDKDYQNIDMLCKHITWSPDQMLDKRPVYFTTDEKKLVCTDIRKFRESPTYIEFMRRVNEYITDGNIFHKVARLS